MLSTIADPHDVLSLALSRLRINGVSPIVIRSRLATLRSRYKLVRYLIVCFAMLLMIPDVWLAVRQNRYVIVREFWNVPLLLASPLLMAWKRCVFFNVNHNLVGMPEQFPWSLRVLARLGFQFILFDGKDAGSMLPGSVRPQFWFPLFPIPEQLSSRRGQRHSVLPVVGVVGDFRAEKGRAVEIGTLLNTLTNNGACEVKIGYRSSAHLLPLNGLGVKFIYTGTRSTYLEFLRSVDILLIFAKRETYYCRHSGTVMDAIACGVVPVVPDYPLLKSQVSDPVVVGATYHSLPEIPTMLQSLSKSCMETSTARCAYIAHRLAPDMRV